MKRLFTFALCAIMMAVCSANVPAQDEPSKKQRKSREEVAEAQARHIAHELAFDDATTQKFITTYQEYQKEMWALGPKEQREHKGEMTDAEAEQAIKDRFTHSQKILDLREKYYKEYSKFLSPKQIERVYELEHRAMSRLGNHRNGPAKQGHHAPQHREPQGRMAPPQHRHR